MNKTLEALALAGGTLAAGAIIWYTTFRPLMSDQQPTPSVKIQAEIAYNNAFATYSDQNKDGKVSDEERKDFDEKVFGNKDIVKYGNNLPQWRTNFTLVPGDTITAWAERAYKK